MSSKQQTKQKFKPSNQQIRLPPHSALPIRGKTNKNTQHKSHSIQNLHIPLDQPQEGRNQKEERIQPSSRKEFNFPRSLGKGDLKHNKLKKNNEKAEKYYTNEVQIKEDKTGKLPEKEFRIMIVKMIKNLENKMEKIKN